MEPIVIIGASGHAGVVIDVIEQEKSFKIVGLVDQNKSVGTFIHSYPILGKEKELAGLIKKHNILGGIIAIGDNWTRYQVMKNVQQHVPNFRFVTVVHPSAQVGSNVSLGQGTIIMPNSVVNRGTKIGDFCIINTGSTVDHDTRIGNFVSLSPGVNTGGNVKVDEYSAIGVGASIIHGISIGKHTVVGAGAVVVKDVPDFVVSYGNPAKVMRSRQIGEKYL